MKCAVVIHVGAGEELYALDAVDSVNTALAAGRGTFSDVVQFTIEHDGDVVDEASALNEGVRRAAEAGCDWIFHMRARDLMYERAFENVAVALAGHDAVWGSISMLAPDESTSERHPAQFSPITRIEEVLANDPRITLASGHFVRTRAALATPLSPQWGEGSEFDYFLRLWTNHPSVKIDAPICVSRDVPDSAARRSAIERVICNHCAALDFGAEFSYRGERFRFAVENPFDLIHSTLLKGRFFEQTELEFIEHWVGRNAAIVEVGGYIGNHVVYYARFMAPESIIVLEPNPESVRLLKRNIESNAVRCANLDHLGLGAAAAPGNFALVTTGVSNHGATRLEAAPEGIAAMPLDQLVTGKVDFIKIDVEGMELDVLAGAARVIATWRPRIMIEVFRTQTGPFEAWLETHRYLIARRFDNVFAVNYCIEPVDG